jgi:CBS domain-containing protein
MSFIVSYNGQFRPYILPDLSHFDNIKQVYKSDQLHSLKTDEKALEFQAPSKIDHSKTDIKSKTIANIYNGQKNQFKKEYIPHHARDLMSNKVKTLDQAQTVGDAIVLMQKFDLRHIPIINSSDILVGIVSDRDLLNTDNNKKLIDCMSREVLTCLDTTRVQDIAKIMLHEKISGIPIIDINHKLTGIITQTDILNLVTRVLSINLLF